MNAPLLGARRIRELFEAHGIRPQKELGQNFVIDPNTIRKVIDIARVSDGDSVLEIGAGAGSLTLGLAAAADRVTAVEFDSRVVPALRESLAGVENVDVVQADAMRLDYASIEASRLVANLPYNIAVPLVIAILEKAPQIASLTVMTQREVGERLAAFPGSKVYGQVSVLVGYWAAASVAARISRNAFFPVPAVDSVVVRIDRRPRPHADYAVLKQAVKRSFEQRRKTLRNTLAGAAGSVAAAERVLAAANIDPVARPETIDLDGWFSIARALAANSETTP
ncbi:MAG: 16S rRNA (adenine(1518)-N(6)/adenine(1519)-N(6))-dimethyltransferase RsmA [Actinomycetota bacterium]|nr:16S rRNA (adenine(1518)-N(6)/adenine(1519)-N(6))-dimethyltransferase RsmA [Actinomycetota bacterium]